MNTTNAASRKKVPERASMLHVRVAESLKDEAAATLGTIGLTTSEAIRLFLHRVVVEQRLPLDLKVPNAATREAIEEGREIAGHPDRFTTLDSLFGSLEETE